MKYLDAKKIMDARREMRRLTIKTTLWGLFWVSCGAAWAGVTLGTHGLTIKLGADPDAQVIATALASFAITAGIIVML